MTYDTSTGRHHPSQAVSETRMPPAQPRHAPYVHPAALQVGAGSLWVCEGTCDVLAVLAAGAARVVVIVGVQGWRWDWIREVRAHSPEFSGAEFPPRTDTLPRSGFAG